MCSTFNNFYLVGSLQGLKNNCPSYSSDFIDIIVVNLETYILCAKKYNIPKNFIFLSCAQVYIITYNLYSVII